MTRLIPVACLEVERDVLVDVLECARDPPSLSLEELVCLPLARAEHHLPSLFGSLHLHLEITEAVRGEVQGCLPVEAADPSGLLEDLRAELLDSGGARGGVRALWGGELRDRVHGRWRGSGGRSETGRG